MESCMQCGEDLAEEARFCAGCGAAVEDKRESTPLQAETFVNSPPGDSPTEAGGVNAEDAQPTREERNMAMYVHASTFVGLVIPFGNLIGPLIIWLMKREESPFVDGHGRTALNFQISLSIYVPISIIPAFAIIGATASFGIVILVLVVVGILIMLGLIVLNLVMTIIAIVKASEGKKYKYPLAIPFFKQST